MGGVGQCSEYTQPHPRPGSHCASAVRCCLRLRDRSAHYARHHRDGRSPRHPLSFDSIRLFCSVRPSSVVSPLCQVLASSHFLDPTINIGDGRSHRSGGDGDGSGDCSERLQRRRLKRRKRRRPAALSVASSGVWRRDARDSGKVRAVWMQMQQWSGALRRTMTVHSDDDDEWTIEEQRQRRQSVSRRGWRPTSRSSQAAGGGGGGASERTTQARTHTHPFATRLRRLALSARLNGHSKKSRNCRKGKIVSPPVSTAAR